jgi:hypothetical protein
MRLGRECIKILSRLRLRRMRSYATLEIDRRSTFTQSVKPRKKNKFESQTPALCCEACATGSDLGLTPPFQRPPETKPPTAPMQKSD